MKDKQTELSFILNENPQQKKSLLYKASNSWVLENDTNLKFVYMNPTSLFIFFRNMVENNSKTNGGRHILRPEEQTYRD